MDEGEQTVLKKRFFKTKKEVEVAFELAHEKAEHVQLLCEANDWEPIDMKRSRQGTFRTRMRLPKEQRIQFRYLIDRTTWANDDEADSYCRNEFGGENSVLDTKTIR